MRKHYVRALSVLAVLALPAAGAAQSQDAPPAVEEVAEESEASSELVAQVDNDFDGVDDTLEVSGGSIGEEGEEEEEVEPGPLGDFSLGGSISTNFALGAIVVPDEQSSDSVVMTFSLNGGYAITDTIRAGISMAFTKYASNHGLVKQNEQRFQDIGLTLSHGSLYVIPGADINISGNLSASLPVSDFSRAQRLRTRIGAGLNFSRSFGNFSTSYAFNVKKNFHAYTSIVLNAERRNLDVLQRSGGAEAVSENLAAANTGINTEWTVSHSLGLSYRFWETGLSASLGFAFAEAWTYNDDSITADDEFVNDNAVSGRGRAQTMTGSFGLSYGFLDHFSASLNLATSQLPLTADNRRVRFPWVDTQSGNLSYTNVGFTLSANY